MAVGRDGGDLRVAHGDLGVVGRELEVLLVLLGAVVPAREREDQGVVALDLAELSRKALVIGQLVVGEGAAGGDVAAHDLLLSLVAPSRERWPRSPRLRAWRSTGPDPWSAARVYTGVGPGRHRSLSGPHWSLSTRAAGARKGPSHEHPHAGVRVAWDRPSDRLGADGGRSAAARRGLECRRPRHPGAVVGRRRRRAGPSDGGADRSSVR